MKQIKIIPCLDVKDGRVVKGVKFENLRDVRDPVEAAGAYCREGADELVFLDIFATVEDRRTRLEWVKRVCDVVTIPFAVGGGISSIEDMKVLFGLGVDKVSINTAAVRNPELITMAAKEFGKERLVVAVDGKKNPLGGSSPRLEVVVGVEMRLQVWSLLAGQKEWRSWEPVRFYSPARMLMVPKKATIWR